MSTTTAQWSIDEALALVARANKLRPGDPMLRGSRFTIAYGGVLPDGLAYLLLDDGHIIQRREVVAQPGQWRRSVGGYVGTRHVQHRITMDPHRGLVAEVEDASTRVTEALNLCVPWPSNQSVAHSSRSTAGQFKVRG